jgi:hypothetical protein
MTWLVNGASFSLSLKHGWWRREDMVVTVADSPPSMVVVSVTIEYKKDSPGFSPGSALREEVRQQSVKYLGHCENIFYSWLLDVVTGATGPLSPSLLPY